MKEICRFKKIWIDMANSPHVAFFLPILRILASDEHNIFITLRNFNQTVELAEKFGIVGQVIGNYGGRTLLGKSVNLIERSMQLIKFAKGKGIDIAVSHNSYTQVIAGRLANVKVVTLMDYEGQLANHLAFRIADKIIVPDSFPDQDLKRFGAHPRKVFKYNGFKEQVYLSDFKPNESFHDDIVVSFNLPSDWDIKKTILVMVRTPATMATYHRFKNSLFDKLLYYLSQMPELTVVTLPRTTKQRAKIKTKFVNLKVPNRVLDGKNLIYYSDLVISAGGTMNREAAILGTPAYTIFAGLMPSVDKRLIEMGRMVPLLCPSDFNNIEFKKKKPKQALKNPNLCKEILHEILT